MIFNDSITKEARLSPSLAQWHIARSKLYAQVATWEDYLPREIYFDFSNPNCGWMDISIYADGNHCHTFPVSAAFDPFTDIKKWMEAIVDDTILAENMSIEADERTIVLHYEHVRLAEKGTKRMFTNGHRAHDEWQQCDAMSYPDIGLFYLYDSAVEDIAAVCLCNTKQFLSALYHAMLEFARNGKHDIGKERSYMSSDDRGRQDLYNSIKSPMVEWGIYSDHAYRHLRPAFHEREPIRETIHMWPDWGEACFWDDRGIGCGDTHYLLFGDEQNEREIDLAGIDGLHEWYNEFDCQSIPEGMSAEKRIQWLAKGWDVAKRVRQVLPPHVDLYYMWKSYKGVKDGKGHVKTLARIVPDSRDIDERSRNRMMYKLY